jgi:RND superfamily putative drug exporter
VVIGWIALTIAGVAVSGPASDRLANDSSVPDTEGWETTLAIAERYDGGSSPLLPVVTLPAGTRVDSPGVKAELAAVDARLRSVLPHSRIASFASTGSRAFVSEDGRTVFALAYPRSAAESDWGENPEAAQAATRRCGASRSPASRCGRPAWTR